MLLFHCVAGVVLARLPTRALVKQLGRCRVEEAIKAFQARLADDLDADLDAAEAPSDKDM